MDKVYFENSKDDDIDLHEIFSVIWQGKYYIIAVTIIFGLASIFYAKSLSNLYKSEVLLSPVTQQNGMKLSSQLGGLAALAGVSFGGGGGGDKTSLALEILKSREFLSDFIEKEEMLVPLMAAEAWSRVDNSLIINSDIYDVKTKAWVRKINAPLLPKPSNLEAQEAFSDLISIIQDKDTGMVKLSIEYYSPYLAKKWLDSLVININNEMRNRDVNEAKRSIAYLEELIGKTNIADVRVMLFSLIEEQTKTLMLANVREEYVFETVDPAFVPEKKSGPKRALICIVGTMLGTIITIIMLLIRYFVYKQ